MCITKPLNKILLSICLLFFSLKLFSEPVSVENLVKKKNNLNRPSVAVVLAGGGSKGFAHLPILKMLEQEGIPIDMIVGTSIGAIIGGLYCAGYSSEEIIHRFSQMDWTPMFSDFAVSPYEELLGSHSIFENPVTLNMGLNFSLNLGKGLSNGQNVYQMLKCLTLKYPSQINFDDLKIPFRAVTTNMLTGEAIVLQDGDLAEAIRASMSLPGVFEPFEIDGYYYMDGGLRYNLAINVAKNMGYDIIIAVDISQKVRDDPQMYNSNPAVAIMNTITIAQATTTQALYKDADLVITPELKGFGTLDFKKAQEIYKAGEIAAEKNKEAIVQIRKKIFPEDYDSKGSRVSTQKKIKERGSYRYKPNLIPTKLVVNGEVKQDSKYIKNSFKKIYDKELSEENFTNFMRDIYLTGNYISVKPRVICEDDETELQLLLTQKEKHSSKILLGADFQQTISTMSTTIFNFSPELQLRGLTGIGSVLAVRGTSINDYGLSLYYFQPFNPYIFLQMDSNLLNKRFASTPNVMLEFSRIQDTLTWKNNIIAGVRTAKGNLVETGIYFNWHKNEIENYTEDDTLYYLLEKDSKLDYYLNDDASIKTKSAGLVLKYTYDSRDRSLFSNKGFFLDIESSASVPISDKIDFEDFFIKAKLDVRKNFSCGKKVSIGLSGIAGSDILQGLKKTPFLIPTEGFSTYDRIYFPQISDNSAYGLHKAAIAMSIQFQPWKNLTILGGQVIFRFMASYGNVIYDWNDSFKNVLWNTSFGAGVKIKEGLSIFIRGGVGSTKTQELTPFFAMDLGSIRF